jgi:dCMP deaminase
MAERKGKEEYYLGIAESVAQDSTCIRRKYGAIIVKNDEIIASGYNGAPRKVKNCCDAQFCLREELHIPAGERYELCRSVHAEQNAIISAPRKDTMGAILYMVGIDANTGKYTSYNQPCKICKRMIINAGILLVITREYNGKYRVIPVEDFIQEMDIELESAIKEAERDICRGDE